VPDHGAEPEGSDLEWDPALDDAEYHKLQDFLKKLLGAGAVEDAPPNSLTPESRVPVRFGRYVIKSKIGEGGQGSVYRAFDTGPLERDVALKILSPDLVATPHLKEQFQEEARNAANLQHEHLVAVYDFGEEPIRAEESIQESNDDTKETPRQAYIVYELVEYPANENQVLNLRTRLAQTVDSHRGRWSGKSCPRRRGLRVMIERLAEVALAIAYAHDRGVTHRDLSPSNILIDARERWRVTDFGLSGSPHAVGTPYYTSPEQAIRDRRSIGWESDVYSLGAILYEILACRPPFEGTADDVLEQHLTKPPIPPRKLARGVPYDVERVCLKALSKEPSDRPSSAREFATLLKRWLEGTPSPLRGFAPIYWTRLWCAKNWQATVGAVAVATGGIAFAVYHDRQRDTNLRLEVLRNQAVEAREYVRIERQIEAAEVKAAAGQWRDAHDSLRRILEDPWLPVNRHDEIRLRIVRSKISLNSLAGLDEELQEIAASDLPPRLRAKLQFESAIYNLHRSAEQSVAGMKQFTSSLTELEKAALAEFDALKSNLELDLPDRLTATALAADDATSAIAALEGAIRLDPFHPYARPYCLSLCMWMARFKDAEILARTWIQAAPRDPVPVINLAFIAALTNDETGAEELLRQLGQPNLWDRPISGSTLAAGRNVVKSILGINEEFPNLATDPSGIFRMIGKLVDLQLPLLQTHDVADSGMFVTPALPKQRVVVARFVMALRNGTMPLLGNPKRALVDLEGTDAFIAPGTVGFARILVRLQQIPARQPDRLKYQSDIAEDLAAIIDDPSLFDVRRVAWMMLAVYGATKSTLDGVSPEESDQLRTQARIDLSRAAMIPNPSSVVQNKILQIAAKFNDKGFTEMVRLLLKRSSE
ncbi:MAG: protein kinase, partial [Planctomycetota bacterium]|nr:protein kinase [Planctomycetota bacterium]